MMINIKERAGSFAENKDKAASIRDDMMSGLEGKDHITLDFTGVEGATQSFVHALLAKPLREKTALVLERILFKGCNDDIKSIITIVTEYLQE